MGDSPRPETGQPPDPPPGRQPWFLLGLLVLFLLLFLFTISPVLTGALAALALVGVVLALLPEGEPPAPSKPKTKKRNWVISGRSPVRQELTFTGDRRCFIGFWFLGNQAIDYRFDVFDGEGNEVRLLHAYPVAAQPNDLCWAHDEAGPGGFIWTTDKHPWKVTLRYDLLAREEKAVRSANLHVEVKPPEGVTIPAQPTPVPGPVVKWGRLETPEEQLKTLPPGTEWTGPKGPPD